MTCAWDSCESSGWGRAGKAASSHDGYFLEPTKWTKGSQASSGVWRDSVGKNSPYQCRRRGFNPWCGTIPHTTGQVSLRTTTTEPGRQSRGLAATEPTCQISSHAPPNLPPLTFCLVTALTLGRGPLDPRYHRGGAVWGGGITEAGETPAPVG